MLESFGKEVPSNSRSPALLAIFTMANWRGELLLLEFGILFCGEDPEYRSLPTPRSFRLKKFCLAFYGEKYGEGPQTFF